jgi:hypothetical protein
MSLQVDRGTFMHLKFMILAQICFCCFAFADDDLTSTQPNQKPTVNKEVLEKLDRQFDELRRQLNELRKIDESISDTTKKFDASLPGWVMEHRKTLEFCKDNPSCSEEIGKLIEENIRLLEKHCNEAGQIC